MNIRITRYILTIVALYFSANTSVSGAQSNANCNFRQLTKQVYVIVGSDHETCSKEEIKHPLTNPSVIIGETGVIAIDPGSSLQVGRLVLQRLKLITNKPVVAVLNTHIHGL